MKTRILDSPAEVAAAAADVVGEWVARRPDAVFALPTGRTPLPFYDEVARRQGNRSLDLALARGFNLDELVVPAGDPRSFRAFMELHVWGRAGFREQRCEIPNGAAPDPEAEALRYEQAIVAAGGLGLGILGVGADGHVAYNLPGTAVLPTHVVRLPDGLASALEVPPEQRPLRAITMGIHTLRDARGILVLATGAAKARAVQALVRGPEQAEWPCSFLQGHPDIMVLLDREAASAL